MGVGDESLQQHLISLVDGDARSRVRPYMCENVNSGIVHRAQGVNILNATFLKRLLERGTVICTNDIVQDMIKCRSGLGEGEDHDEGD